MKKLQHTLTLMAASIALSLIAQPMFADTGEPVVTESQVIEPEVTEPVETEQEAPALADETAEAPDVVVEAEDIEAVTEPETVEVVVEPEDIAEPEVVETLTVPDIAAEAEDVEAATEPETVEIVVEPEVVETPEVIEVIEPVIEPVEVTIPISMDRSNWPKIVIHPADGSVTHNPCYMGNAPLGEDIISPVDAPDPVWQLQEALRGGKSGNFNGENLSALVTQPVIGLTQIASIPVQAIFERPWADVTTP